MQGCLKGGERVGYLPVLTWANPLIHGLEQQALIPTFGTNPVEMGGAGREEAIFATLMADPYYGEAFAAAFPDRPEADLFTLTRALAAFERSLITVGSSYDRFKRMGEQEGISAAAKRGENLFFGERLECYHCHGGVNFTENIATSRMRMVAIGFHNTGLYDPPPEGIAAFTLRPENSGRFRTPSVRNVALTAPTCTMAPSRPSRRSWIPMRKAGSSPMRRASPRC